MSAQKLRVVGAAVLAVALAAGAFAETKKAHFEHTFKASEGTKVMVDVSFHDVTVTVAPGDVVTAVVDLEVNASEAKAKRLLEQYEPKFTVMKIRSARKSTWSLFNGGRHRIKGRVQVTMPPGKNLVLDTASGDCAVEGDLGDGKLSADVASGDVEVKGAARTIDVDSASGDAMLVITRPVEKVSADTASGDVEIMGPVAHLLADTASGDVVATGLTGTAFVDTASGDATLSWASISPSAKIDVDTASGDVKLALPAATSLSGKVDTASGGIRSDFPGTKSDRGRTLRLRAEGPAVHVTVDTASGAVQLTAAD